MLPSGARQRRKADHVLAGKVRSAVSSAKAGYCPASGAPRLEECGGGLEHLPQPNQPVLIQNGQRIAQKAKKSVNIRKRNQAHIPESAEAHDLTHQGGTLGNARQVSLGNDGKARPLASLTDRERRKMPQNFWEIPAAAGYVDP